MKSITYQQSGVQRDLAHSWVEHIKKFAESTRTSGVIADIGGFAGLYALPHSLQSPILVSASDGVGTKIKLACTLDAHEVVGQDVVAMCVNDILTYGARPLFFLDYLATSRLDVSIHSRVMSGISNGCKQACCALLGGETAQMPKVYTNDFYELAGFAVGIVERDKLIHGSNCKPNDVLIGLSSSGIHSNGYSLIHTILEHRNIHLQNYIPTLQGTLAEHLMIPTKIYVQNVLELLNSPYGEHIHGMAHITGGGLLENISRILPIGIRAHIDWSTFTRPMIFDWLADIGPVDENEMQKTFNLGIGYVLIVDENFASICIDFLQKLGQQAYWIGVLTNR